MDRNDEEKITQHAISTRRAEKRHYLVWQGPHAVCTSCDYRHTIPLDITKYDLKDGQVVTRN